MMPEIPKPPPCPTIRGQWSITTDSGKLEVSVVIGGGWCEQAVYDRIRDIITDAVIQELEDRLHGEQSREREG